MRQTLKQALRYLFGDEGAYVNRDTDRGGPTKYGITIKTLSRFLGRQATIQEVKNLTLAVAEEIYRRFYWPQAGCDQLPPGLDYVVFNSAVMSGPERGVKILQIVLQSAGLYDGKIDGDYGPGTHDGVRRWQHGMPALIQAYIERYVQFCRGIKGKTGWASNGRGWTYRLTGVDPKGIFAKQPGVVGLGKRLWEEHQAVANFDPDRAPIPKARPIERPVEISEQMESQAIPSKPTAVDIATKPETLSSVTAVLSTILSAASDSPPLQYALAAVVVMAASVAMWTFYKRIRNDEVL